MKVKFSRHANRRANLYGIDKDAIIRSIKLEKLSAGRNELLARIEGVAHKVKIVAVVESDIITVVTNYPLKRGRS